ncbi:DUF5682 family protein [Streptomyces sp. INA 01156]
MRGAAGAVRVLLGHEDARTFGDRVASWIDGATDPDSRTALTARIGGLLSAAGPLLETAEPALEPLLTRVIELPDREFLDRLPALRGGFDTLSPAARDRLLAAVDERLGTAHIADTDGVDPAALAAWTAADFTARERLRSLGLVTDPSRLRPKTPRRTAHRGTRGATPQQHTPSAVPQPAGAGRAPNRVSQPAPQRLPAEPDARPGPTARPGPQGTARPGAEDTAQSPERAPGRGVRTRGASHGAVRDAGRGAVGWPSRRHEDGARRAHRTGCRGAARTGGALVGGSTRRGPGTPPCSRRPLAPPPRPSYRHAAVVRRAARDRAGRAVRQRTR